ncbi:MAG TPA: Mth938-like domain-containing protein [Methylocystis sp.]|nr:Mth938-like domain-containing protein [Methylocystis sp.]
MTGFVAGRHKIDDYGGGGFRFADMSHRGAVLATASGVSALNISEASQIDAGLLDHVLADPSGRPDLLLIGTGATLLPLPAALRAKLRAAGVGCETMATGAAVRTYNLLVDENRRVAALLVAI